MTTCLTQDDVEKGCIEENIARFDQTRSPHPTPPMSEPLFSTFTGPLTQSTIEALLDGRLDVDSLSSGPTRSFLLQCRWPCLPSQTPPRVTPADNTEFWSKAKENKSSEPNGLHNGHFKAGATSLLLSQCDAIFRDIPMNKGFVPDQWKNLMNFAIEKKPGEIRVSKMRTIQLMNSESNANNKKIGREAMYFAEDNSIIPPGQCGSRKNLQAMDLAVSKRLTWDLLRTQRRSAGWISNDAKSCFDRIVHWVAIACLLRFGMSYSSVHSMFRTLQLATHRVRTGFGDSKRTFFSPSDTPFQGCGQGNGAGPTMWVAISAVLITMMAAEGCGFSSLSALSSLLVVADCFCFVDDSDVVQASDSVYTTGESLLPSVQNALNLWTGGVSATGGAITPDKSFWWLFDFQWCPALGMWKFRRKSNLPGDITMIAPDGNLVTLNRKEPEEAEKTLGVMMAPDGNETAQFTKLHTAALEWSRTVSSSYTLQRDIIPMLTTTILKTLEYPMALTTFSAEMWTKIMSRPLMVCLPKAGVCRSFPRSVVYAPLRFQGLGIPHPFATQVSTHLETLLRHGTNLTNTGTYLTAALEAHQLEIGLPIGLFQQQFQNTGILTTDSWLKKLWQEMESLNIHLAYHGSDLTMRRDGDSFLTQLFIDDEVDQQDLLWLNWCRQYLHAVTLSDLVTADGKRLTSFAWNGERDPSWTSPYNWPRVARPSAQRWDLWRTTLHRLLLRPQSNTHELLTPLGLWTDSIEHWKWLYSPSQNVLYQRRGQVWLKSVPSERRHHTYRLPILHWISPLPFLPSSIQSSSILSTPLPLDVKRATVEPISSSPGTTTLTGTGFSRLQPPPPSFSSFLERWEWARQQMSIDLDWVPEIVDLEGNEEDLASALHSGTLRIVSDGSYKDRLGTAAVRITTKDRKSCIWIRCQTPGLADDQSAYRSELIGILASMLAVSWLSEVWNSSWDSPSSSVTFACDGLSALNHSFSTQQLHPSQAQFDLLSAIRGALRASSSKWVTRHVLGHADAKKSWKQLSWWERRNVEVDRAAQKHREDLFGRGELIAANPWFMTERWSLYIDGVKQSRLDRSAIGELITVPPFKEYVVAKGRITRAALPLIDWQSVGRAMSDSPFGLRKWVTKHTVGMCSVGKFRVLWKWDSVNQCPRCAAPEDHLHVPRCPAPSASKEWDLRLEAFRQWMQSQSTDPAIISFFVHLLTSIRSFNSSCRPTLGSGHFRQAASAQLTIGAQGLLEGLLSSHWAIVQQLYYSRIKTRRTGKRWLSLVVQQLWLLGFQMWEHRNAVKYSDHSVSNKRLSRQVNNGIRRQHAMGPADLPPPTRSMFSKRLEKLLRLSLHERQQWLRLVTSERNRESRLMAARRRMFDPFVRPQATA